MAVPGLADTPPCSEGVAWVVLTEALTLSATQVDAFAAIYPHRCGPVHPLGRSGSLARLDRGKAATKAGMAELKAFLT